MRAVGFPQFTQLSSLSFLRVLPLWSQSAALPLRHRGVDGSIVGPVTSRPLLAAVDRVLRDAVPAALGPLRHENRGWQAKWWSGNPDLHYECWPRSKTTVELGLHFEADPLTNARLLAAFRARAKPIARALGDAVRIEEWDKGWARVWEPAAQPERDAAAARALGGRLALYIRTLEPILRDELPADVPWTVATPAAAPRPRPRARSR